MATNMKVVSSQLEKEEEKNPTYKLVDYPKPVTPAQTRSIKDFLKLQPVPINRDFVERAKKLVKVLANCRTVKQNEVDIVKYTGKTTHHPKKGTWINGEEYVLNSNTRGHIWRSYMNGQCIGGVNFMEVPKEVIANVYEMDTIDSIISAYNSIDSEESVETSSATLSGVLRAQHMNKLDSVKLKTGKFVMSLNVSAPLTNKFGYQALTGDVYTQVSEMKDIIKLFDILKVTGKGALSTQLSMGVAFLAGKYAGTQDHMYMDALNRLSDVNLKKDVEKISTMVSKDGIDWIIKASLFNPYNDGTLSKALPFCSGLFNDRGGALNYISACWKSYLDGEEMTQPPAVEHVMNAYVDFVQDTWSPIEESI